MSLSVRFFSGLLVLLTGFFPAIAQTSSPEDVAWFESFFEEGQKQSAEQALNDRAARLNKAEEVHDLVAEAHWSKELGLIHLTRTHSYDSATDFFIRSLAIEDSLQLSRERIFTYLCLARVYEEIGDYFKSEEQLDDALELSRQLQDDRIQMLAFNQLGKVNARTGKTEEASNAYRQALNYKDDVDDPGMEAEVVFNLANLYRQQGNYQQALDRHKQALAIRRSIHDRVKEALSLNEIGEVYHLMKNEERALANHVAALEIRQSLGDKRAIAASYNNIGALYFQQNNLQRAVANLELARDAAREAQAQEQAMKSYDYLSQCYARAGDFKKALEYRELFVDAQDFLLREKSDHQLVETQNRYVVEQKQTQIRHLDTIRKAREKEIEEQKKFRSFLVTILVLGGVIVVLVIFLYVAQQRSNRKLKAAHTKVQEQNVQLQELNATKNKFFSIISHDLKGPLNSFTSFSGLLMNHTDHLSKDEIRMLAKDLDKSLKNLFTLLENLLEWSRSQTGNIEFKPEVFDLHAVLLENKNLLNGQAQNKQIEIRQPAESDLPVHAHRNSINTVIRNLISNAIKFTPQGGTITLNAQRTGTIVTVSVQDTGVGMSKEVMEKLFRIDTKHSTKGTADEKGTGLGLILCREFVEKNGGRIWVESAIGKGSSFYFTVPASTVPAPKERAPVIA